MINAFDGLYTIFCWRMHDGEGEPDLMEFSDFQAELRERAQALLNAGRYKYVWMGRWNEIRSDWDELADFGPSPC